MADRATLEQRLEALREIQGKGILRAVMGDEEITYRSYAELQAAIRDLEGQLARLTAEPVRTVRFTTSKGV